MVTGPAGALFRGKFVYKKTLGTRRRDRHVTKRSSDPRFAYPEVKIPVRDLVRVVGIVAPLPVGGRYQFSREIWGTKRGGLQAAKHSSE